MKYRQENLPIDTDAGSQRFTLGRILRQPIVQKASAVAVEPVGLSVGNEPIGGDDGEASAGMTHGCTNTFDTVQCTDRRKSVG
jgi:hypothetical protein